jgi:hypothetical protein
VNIGGGGLGMPGIVAGRKLKLIGIGAKFKLGRFGKLNRLSKLNVGNGSSLSKISFSRLGSG